MFHGVVHFVHFNMSRYTLFGLGHYYHQSELTEGLPQLLQYLWIIQKLLNLVAETKVCINHNSIKRHS